MNPKNMPPDFPNLNSSQVMLWRENPAIVPISAKEAIYTKMLGGSPGIASKGGWAQVLATAARIIKPV